MIRIEEQELYFFSSNHSDYAAPGHLDNLHPDIIESYPAISVRYFHDYIDGINALLALGLPSAKTSLQVKGAVSTLVKIDKNQSIFEQAFQYVDKRFTDIRVLPKRLFITHYPFITAAKTSMDAPPFTLLTDNQEVYNLFLELAEKVKSGILDWSAMELDEKSDERRSVELIHQLRACNVYHISFNHKNVELPGIRASKCTCLNCKFNRSEFAEVLLELDTALPGGKAELKTAFLQYIVGNIMLAIAILKQIVSDSEQSRKWLTYYIANYNLSLLGKMYKFSSSEERDQPWVKELQGIDMEGIYISSRSASTDDILDYLKEADFLSKAIIRIKELAGKIKDHQIDRNRGWNDDSRSLLDQYFEAVGFVEHNFIMLDYFTNLNTLTYHFMDGTFASYASHHELGGRLLHFTDTIVQHIVSYANSDDIIKCRNRYDIRIAEFEYIGAESKLVKDLCNLLNSYPEVVNHFEKSENPGQRFFWKRFRTKFHNSLTLAAIMKISKDEVNLICEALLPFIKIETHFQNYELSKTLSYFIRNNALLIDRRHLESFLIFAYTAEHEQRDVLIHTISNISKIEDLELNLTETQWAELQARYLVNTEIQENSTIISEICCLFDFLKENEYKDEIAKFMTDYLKHKFNSDVYYTAVIHRLIKPTRKMNSLYDKEMLGIAEGGRRPRIFETSYYNSDSLDQYVNFMFCFNNPFDARFVQAAGDLDNYYRWILDIDGYDYQSFHPDWLFNHLTTYYRQRFKNSKQLEHWTRKSALNSKSSKISRFYIELYTDSPI